MWHFILSNELVFVNQTEYHKCNTFAFIKFTIPGVPIICIREKVQVFIETSKDVAKKKRLCSKVTFAIYRVNVKNGSFLNVNLCGIT